MGAIQNFTLADFKAAVMGEVSNGNVQISSAEQADKSIREYFNNLAVRDDGENPNEYETDFAEFKESVGNCVKNILTSIQDGANQITKAFTGGAKESGAQLYDIVDEYTNGELTKSTFGFDDNNDGQITGEEKYYEFQAGVPRANGAQNEDTMNVYEDGKLTEVITGYDENHDGFRDGDEITSREKVDE